MKTITFLVKVFGTFVLLLLIFWTGALLFLQTEKGQIWMKQTVIQMIEKETQSQVAIEKIDFVFPIRIRIHKLNLAIHHIPLCTVELLELNCLSPELLEGRIVCSKVYAQGIHIQNHPLITQKGDSLFNFSDTPFPVYLKIKKITIENVTLDSALVDPLISNTTIQNHIKSSKFKLEGFLKNNPADHTFITHLLLTTQPEQFIDHSLQLAIDVQNHQLSLSANVNHLSLKNLSPIDFGLDQANLTWHSTAPLTSWNAFLSNSLQKPIQGSFEINIIPFSGETIALQSNYELISNNQFHLYDTELNTSFLYLQGDFLASYTKEKISGALKMHFQHQNVPFNLSTIIQLYPDRIRLDQLHLEGLGSTLMGQGEISLDNFISTAQLTVETKNLDSLFPFFISQKMTGSAQMHITMQPSKKKSSLSQAVECWVEAQNVAGVDWKVENVSIKSKGIETWKNLLHDCALSSQIQIANLQLEKGTVEHLAIESQQKVDWPSLKFNLEFLRFASKKIDIPNFPLEFLTGSIKQEPTTDLSRFELNGKGTFKETVEFNLIGTLEQRQEAFLIHLETLKGNLGPYPLATLAPFDFYFLSKNQFQIQGLNFSLGEGTFSTHFSLDQNQIHIQAEGKQIPTELLHWVYPDASIVGRISFDTSLKGSLTEPQGSIKLLFHHIQIAEEFFATRPFIDGEMDVAIREKKMEVKGELNGIGKNPIKVQGILPLTMQLYPFEIISKQESDLNLRLEGEGDLDPYMQLFFNHSTHLTGQGKFDLMFAGSMQSPKVNGRLSISNGTYERFDTGAIYNDIQAQLEGNGESILLKSLSAQDSKNGSIAASGHVSLDSKQEYPFEFKIKPSKISMMDSDYATITASGDLIFSGDQKKGHIHGTLSVDQANIRMEEALPTPLTIVDVTYINLPEGETLSSVQSLETNWPVHLNIKVHIPETFMITGKNLDSEWKGTVEITGTPTDPLLNGELRVMNGTYNFNGKKFFLTQGNIHFAGAAAKKTSLYVVASKEIDRIKAEILVKGPLNKLTVSFRSNPPLSQREILSYILFNRGISDITASEGDKLSQSFIDLNSTNPTQTDLLTRLRNNIGIDRLDFTSTDKENKEVSLQVGKYITENVMVSINKSINASANRVAIEAKLRKNIQAQAEVGDDSQAKIMIKWKKDY